jgi:hypothetical protein
LIWRASIWRAGDRRTRLLGFALGTLSGVYFGLYAVATLSRGERYPFGDFFALWADGRLLRTQPAAWLYDPTILPAWQAALDGGSGGLSGGGSTPFSYPPDFLPVVRLLGLLPYDAAYAAFMAVSLALYLLAVAPPPPRGPVMWLALVAPATILTLVAGQSGLLAGALLLGGLRRAPARPLLGGVLLGLSAFKPQLGVLLPVALVAAGAWRCLAAAAATVVLVAVATSAGFGWHIWADWLFYLPAFAARFDRESGDILYLMPTLTGTLRLLGVAAGLIRPAQALLALAAIVWVWRACRGGLGPRAVLVLATATLLATPYAFVYDLPMLTGAALLFADARLRAGGGLATMEVAALTMALLLPVVLTHAGNLLPIGPLCLLLLAAVLIADSRAASPISH